MCGKRRLHSICCYPRDRRLCWFVSSYRRSTTYHQDKQKRCHGHLLLQHNRSPVFRIGRKQAVRVVLPCACLPRCSFAAAPLPMREGKDRRLSFTLQRAGTNGTPRPPSLQRPLPFSIATNNNPPHPPALPKWSPSLPPEAG
jgi:hypothetical protein